MHRQSTTFTTFIGGRGLSKEEKPTSDFQHQCLHLFCFFITVSW